MARSYRLSTFLKDLNADNIDPALAVIEEEGHRLSNDELRLLMFAWTKFDGPGAYNYALFSPEKERRKAAGKCMHSLAPPSHRRRRSTRQLASALCAAWGYFTSLRVRFRPRPMPWPTDSTCSTLTLRLHTSKIYQRERDGFSLRSGETTGMPAGAINGKP